MFAHLLCFELLELPFFLIVISCSNHDDNNNGNQNGNSFYPINGWILADGQAEYQGDDGCDDKNEEGKVLCSVEHELQQCARWRSGYAVPAVYMPSPLLVRKTNERERKTMIKRQQFFQKQTRHTSLDIQIIAYVEIFL
jgi:hypothetical protein